MSKGVDEKIAIDVFKVDQESHIVIDHTVCRSLCKIRHCTRICPGGLYTYDPQKDQVLVEHSGCLECGTCLVGCVPGAIKWRYPRGGHGVQYRYG